MTRIIWDQEAEKTFSYGLDRAVFYDCDGYGHAWNGLVSIQENYGSSGENSTASDGAKIMNQYGYEDFAISLRAFTYPEVMESYLGEAGIPDHQQRKPFGLSYRTMLEGDHYLIHIVYNVTVQPSTMVYQTINDAPELADFNWALETAPPMPNYILRPASHIIVDTRRTRPEALVEVEENLYGTSTIDPRQPTIDELYAIFDVDAVVTIVDNGDWTWTATGPDSMIQVQPDGYYTIDMTNAVYVDDDRYELNSY